MDRRTFLRNMLAASGAPMLPDMPEKLLDTISNEAITKMIQSLSAGHVWAVATDMLGNVTNNHLSEALIESWISSRLTPDRNLEWQQPFQVAGTHLDNLFEGMLAYGQDQRPVLEELHNRGLSVTDFLEHQDVVIDVLWNSKRSSVGNFNCPNVYDEAIEDIESILGHNRADAVTEAFQRLRSQGFQNHSFPDIADILDQQVVDFIHLANKKGLWSLTSIRGELLNGKQEVLERFNDLYAKHLPHDFQQEINDELMRRKDAEQVKKERHWTLEPVNKLRSFKQDQNRCYFKIRPLEDVSITNQHSVLEEAEDRISTAIAERQLGEAEFTQVSPSERWLCVQGEQAGRFLTEYFVGELTRPASKTR